LDSFKKNPFFLLCTLFQSAKNSFSKKTTFAKGKESNGRVAAIVSIISFSRNPVSSVRNRAESPAIIDGLIFA
jgi:hypothetical protein